MYLICIEMQFHNFHILPDTRFLWNSHFPIQTNDLPLINPHQTLLHQIHLHIAMHQKNLEILMLRGMDKIHRKP